MVRASSLFSLGHVPTPSSSSASSSSSTSISTTRTLVAPTTTPPATCKPNAKDTEAPVGTIKLAGGKGFTIQTILAINHDVNDRRSWLYLLVYAGVAVGLGRWSLRARGNLVMPCCWPTRCLCRSGGRARPTSRCRPACWAGLGLTRARPVAGALGPSAACPESG
jgi:hypothetical protein